MLQIEFRCWLLWLTLQTCTCSWCLLQEPLTKQLQHITQRCISCIFRLKCKCSKQNQTFKQSASNFPKMLQTSNSHASKSAKWCNNLQALNFKVSWLLHHITSTKPSATVSAETFIDCWLDELHAIINFKFHTNAADADVINTTNLHMFLMSASLSTTAFNKRTSNCYYIKLQIITPRCTSNAIFKMLHHLQSAQNMKAAKSTKNVKNCNSFISTPAVFNGSASYIGLQTSSK